jgi:hypothetical protein
MVTSVVKGTAFDSGNASDTVTAEKVADTFFGFTSNPETTPAEWSVKV